MIDWVQCDSICLIQHQLIYNISDNKLLFIAKFEIHSDGHTIKGNRPNQGKI